LSSAARHATHTTHAGHAAHTWHALSEAHAAEHLGENVVDVGSFAAHATASRGIEGSHAMGVVEVSLLVIVEDFVGLTGSLETNFGFGAFGFCDLVGVVGQCGLTQDQYERLGAFTWRGM
jgi:hypothetical protein